MSSSDLHEYIRHCNHDRLQVCRSKDRQRVPGETCSHDSHLCTVLHVFLGDSNVLFLGDANVIFCSKKNNIVFEYDSPHHDIPGTRTRNLWMTVTTKALVPLSYQCFPFWQRWRIFLVHRGDWLLIKFCKNDFFRKWFLFSENTFQYLRKISQDVSGIFQVRFP